MWFGTYAGVSRLKDKQWTSYTTTNSKLPNNIIHSFSETEVNGKTTFWIGTNNGLASLDLENKHWTVYDNKNTLSDNRVRVLWGTQKKEGYQLWKRNRCRLLLFSKWRVEKSHRRHFRGKRCNTTC